MARQQPVARKQSRSKRDQQEADSGTGKSGHDEELSSYEQELTGYLQERIRPGLNRGAIPLLARSIAKEIAHREHPNGAPENAGAEDEPSAEAAEVAEAGDEPSAEAGDEPGAEAEDEPSAEAEDEQAEAEDEQAEEDGAQAEEDEDSSAEADDEPGAESDAVAAFEDEMRELQADLGEDWILRFSVQGDDAWLTAEKDDGSQRVEAPTADVLVEAVELLNEAGGRSG